MSSRGFQERRAPAPLNRSSSDQMLLRKRGDDWQYMEPPTSVRPTSRDRKALSNAHDNHYMPPPPAQRNRAATAVLTRLGNDQGGAANGGAFRLNRKEKQFLIKRAKESSLALIDHAHTLDGPIQWHYKGKHRGIQMYRGEGVLENGVPNSAVLGNEQALEYLCGVTTMMGTLEEVSEYFDQATTARMKMKKANDVQDCAVLYSLVWGNTVNPFHRVSVKYTAYEGPAAMTRPRDFCYLECQDTFRHSTGRRGWVLSMHSIKIPSCPEVPGFVRGSVYHSGLVFVEAERPGYMDVMYSLQINFKGHGRVPQFMLNSALKRRLRELIHISREIQVARIAHRTLLDDKDLMPKNLRTTCVNCSRRFWLFLRKTRCRVCGEVVCQACAPIVDYEGAGSNGQHSKTRICVKCYTTSPTTGSWTAPNDQQPWTEQSRIIEFEKKTSMQELPSHRKMQKLDEGDEDEDEDDGDDGGEGRFTFAELEVQSSHSVFAPERFTRSSIASIAPLPVDEIHEYDDADDNSSLHSDDYNYQHQRITSDSEFDVMGGSVTSSVLSRDSYFGRPEPPSMRFSVRRPGGYQSVNEDTPMLLEEAEQPSPREKAPPSPAAPVPSTQPPLHPNTQRSSSESKGSYEFLDGLLDVPIARQQSGESRKRAQTTIRKQGGVVRSELNPTTLHAHNLRYMRSPAPPPPQPLKPEVTLADLEPEPTSAALPPPPPSSPPTITTTTTTTTAATPAPRLDVPVSLDDLVLSSSNPSTNDSFDGGATCSSVDTNSLFSRPSSLILRQVRKNRSKTIQLQTQMEEQFRSTKDIEDRAEDHRRRMAELNQKAIEYTGHRVSTLEITRPSLEPEPVDDEVWRSSTLMEEYRSKRKHTIDALRKKAMSIQEDGRESTETDRTTGSSRSPSWTSALKINEDPSPSLSLSSRIMAEVNLRHSLARSPSLLAPKMSETGSQSPTFGGKKLVRPPSEVVSARGTLDDLSFKPSTVSLYDRPSEIKPQLSVQEEGAEDEDANGHEETKESPSAGAGHPMPWEPEPEATGYVSPRQRRQQEQRDFVSARSLYAEIGMLSKLNSQIAVAEDKNEVDRIKDRIQEQYQIIRGLQLKP